MTEQKDDRPADGPVSEPHRSRTKRSQRPTGAQPETKATAPADPVTEPTGSPARGEDHVVAPSFDLGRGCIGEVEADTVKVVQGGIGAASAEDITVSMGGIGQARADDIAVRMGGIGLARGERISVEMGSVGMAMGGEVSISQGFARTILARDVRIGRGAAQTIIAEHVTFERPGGALLVVARRVEGEVKPLLDWRGALALGAVLAVGFGLMSRRRHS